jgi:hypothetical protein
MFRQEDEMHKLMAVMLALAAPLAAQDADWGRLRGLRPGEVIWIEYAKGDHIKHAKGEMRAWSEESLTFTTRKGETAIARADVRRVAVYGGKSHVKGAVIGAVIGILPGVLVGVGTVVAESGRSAAADVGGGVVGVMGIGAAIGAAVGRTKTVVAYQAPKK